MVGRGPAPHRAYPCDLASSLASPFVPKGDGCITAHAAPGDHKGSPLRFLARFAEGRGGGQLGFQPSVKGGGRVSMMRAVWMEVWVMRLIMETMLSPVSWG